MSLSRRSFLAGSVATALLQVELARAGGKSWLRSIDVSGAPVGRHASVVILDDLAADVAALRRYGGEPKLVRFTPECFDAFLREIDLCRARPSVTLSITAYPDSARQSRALAWKPSVSLSSSSYEMLAASSSPTSPKSKAESASPVPRS